MAEDEEFGSSRACLQSWLLCQSPVLNAFCLSRHCPCCMRHTVALMCRCFSLHPTWWCNAACVCKDPTLDMPRCRHAVAICLTGCCKVCPISQDALDSNNSEQRGLSSGLRAQERQVISNHISALTYRYRPFFFLWQASIAFCAARLIATAAWSQFRTSAGATLQPTLPRMSDERNFVCVY